MANGMIKSTNNKRSLFYYALLIFFVQCLAIFLFQAGKAQAISLNPDPNNIPGPQYDYLYNHINQPAANGCTRTGVDSPVVTRWISPKDQPSSVESVIGSDTKKIALQQQAAGAVCYNTQGVVTIERSIRVFADLSNPGTISPDFTDATTKLDWTKGWDKPGTYQYSKLTKGTASSFTYTPNNGFENNKVYIINIVVKSYNVWLNTDGTAKTIECVAKDKDGKTISAKDIYGSNCPETSVKYNIRVRFSDTKPTISIRASCVNPGIVYITSDDIDSLQFIGDYYPVTIKIGTVENTIYGQFPKMDYQYPIPSSISTSSALDIVAYTNGQGPAGVNDSGSVTVTSKTVRYGPCGEVSCEFSPSTMEQNNTNSTVTFTILSTTDKSNTLAFKISQGNNIYLNKSSVLNLTANTKYTVSYSIIPSNLGELLIDATFGGVPLSGCAAEVIAVRTIPYFIVNGSDVCSGGKITSYANYSGSSWTAGSGAELAVFANDVITDFGSALKTTPHTALTFGNDGSLGNYKPTNCIDTEALYAPPANTVATWPAPGWPTPSVGTYTYTHSGDLDLTTSYTVGTGVKIVLYVDGSVNIKAGIFYNSYTELNDIPSFTLIAKNDINIVGNTPPDTTTPFRLNGTYIAGNTIDTCISSSVSCAQQLIVNGALYANTIKWNRTKGSLKDYTSSNPQNGAAEVVNDYPERYLTKPKTGYFDSITSLSPLL